MGFTSGGYMQRGLGRAQFRKLETVASRLSNCDHFYGNRFFQPSGLSPSCSSSHNLVLWTATISPPCLASTRNVSRGDLAEARVFIGRREPGRAASALPTNSVQDSVLPDDLSYYLPGQGRSAAHRAKRHRPQFLAQNL